MDLIKKLFFSYQKWAWYVNQAKGEYGKFGSFIPETLMIITYLSVKGVDVKFWHVPIAYLLLMVVAGGVGKFLVSMGLVKYNNTIANEHNNELQKIIKQNEEILKHVKSH